MATRTADEWLEMIEDAIASIITGKTSSYSIGGRSFSRLDISALEDLRSYWASKAAESRNGFTTSPDFSGINGGEL